MKIKLNLGCGAHIRKGWINVDKYIDIEALKRKEGWYKNAIYEEGGKFVQADIVKLPFEDNYADHIELQQVLEHLPYRDVTPALTEIYRVLKPGGRFVVSVPNFDGLALDWLDMRMKEFNEKAYINQMEVVFGSQVSNGEFHKCLFSPILLNAMLNTVGFKKGKIGAVPKGIPTPNMGLLGIGKKGSYMRHAVVFADMTK